MIAILSGPVTLQMIAAAPFRPTAFICNGAHIYKVKPLEVVSIDPMLPGCTGEIQNAYRMALKADALILAGRNDCLHAAATRFGLRIHAPEHDAEVDLFKDDADLFA